MPTIRSRRRYAVKGPPMKEDELNRKLANVELPDFEVTGHRGRLRTAPLDWGCFRTQQEAAMMEVAESRTTRAMDGFWDHLVAPRPTWKIGLGTVVDMLLVQAVLRECHDSTAVADASAEDELVRAEAELQRHRQYLVLHKDVDQLPPKYQEVIALHFFEGRQIREIGEILGKREGIVKSLLHDGIEKLRKQMA